MILLALAAAALSPPLEQVDGWEITSDSERCTATRTLAGPTPVMVRVTSRTTSDFAGNIWINFLDAPVDWMGKPFALKSSSGGQFTLPYARLSQPPEGGVSLSGPLALEDRAALAASRSLRVLLDGVEPRTIETGSMAPMMAALTRCGDAILRGWGVDPERMVGLSDGPATLFTNSDYPVAAKRAGQVGRVAVVISVDAAGMPGTCKVVVSSGSASLDSGTCEIVLERARYPRGAAQRWAITSTRWTLRGR